MLGRTLALAIFLFYSLTGLSQEEAMRVERCSAINPESPVSNIYVDKDGEKWVSNAEGLWQVHAADLASSVVLGSAEESLLQLPGGNRDIRWLKGEINDQLGGILTGENKISAAFYNEIQDHLWIGTTESGVFLFRTEPKLRWIKEINKRMPKLRSNRINTIYVDGDDDRHFIGTDEGIIAGKDGRWGLEERYFRFQAIAHRGKEVWLLAEDLIWVVDEKENWRSVEIDMEQVRGSIKDIAFDREGKLWIASEYLTVFDVENERYKIFDGADYFTSNDVNCLSVDRDGAIWVGTQDKGLYVIEKESAMTVTCLLDKELSCDPAINDASLIVKIKSGQPPYTYQWENGLTGENPTNLGVGTYIVTVTDSKGQSKPAEGVVEDTRLKVIVTQERPHNAEGRGAAAAQVKGGKPKFTYLWDNGENGPRAERLEAGSHSVTVTDVNGCSAEGFVEITREAGTLVATIEKVLSDDCEGANHEANLKIAGGVPPFTISWSDPGLSGESIKGLAAGTYYATVTDAQQQKVEAAVTFAEVEQMTASASQLKAANLEGSNGSATVDVEGGAGKLNYQWDNGESKLRAQKLSAGAHTVTVTDENGCKVVASVEITKDVAELVADIQTTGKSLCFGDGLNAIKAVVSGGEGPYQYTWKDMQLKTAELGALEGGVYYLTVTDSKGSEATASISIPKIEPLQLEATVHAAATTNNADGRASIKAVGGTGVYTYIWSSGETNKDAARLAPGKQTVTVTDAASCNAIAEVTITESISEMALFLNKVGEIKCFGEENGRIEAVVQGGKAPYTYQWNNADIEGNIGQNLTAGFYEVTVTDIAGNIATASVDLDMPKKLEAEIIEQRGVTDEASADGKAEVYASGGSGSYTYLWDNQYTSQKAENLTLGNHSVTVSDANGCSTVVEFETKQKILPALSLDKLRSGQVVQMQMLQFDADSTNINALAGPVLDEVYDFLKDNPGVVIRVEGHTNNVPPDDYCDKLSTSRAKSVAEYVVQKGVAGERVYYKGYGKRQPIYSNRTPEGRRKNQRVEIKILEIGDAGS